jgi:hypothetical protein
LIRGSGAVIRRPDSRRTIVCGSGVKGTWKHEFGKHERSYLPREPADTILRILAKLSRQT